MDPELINKINQAVSEGLASTRWLLIALSLIAAAIGAFVGPYLKKKAEDLATKENFRDLLDQLIKQTKATEKIKGEVAEQTGSSIEALKAEFAEDLESLKGRIAIATEDRKAELTAAADELAYVREHYAGIKEYSSAQAEALRQAYLAVFEHPESSRLPTNELVVVIESVLDPLRRHLGTVDERTSMRIYAVANYLRGFQGREKELEGKRIAIWEITERTRRFVKADKIAYRLGLVNRLLKEVAVMRVRVLQDGIPILGKYTYPQKGVEVEISEDEWISDDVQSFLREKKIEKTQSGDDHQRSNE